MATLQQWQRADNYAGDDMSNFYILYGRSRDSDCLDNANFDSIQERLHGLDGWETHSFGHWAVGWIESIFVRIDAPTETIQEAQAIIDALEQYPVLDDEKHSEYEWNEATRSAKDALETWLYGKHPIGDNLDDVAHWIVMHGSEVGGTDDYMYSGAEDYYPTDRAITFGLLSYRRNQKQYA